MNRYAMLWLATVGTLCLAACGAMWSGASKPEAPHDCKALVKAAVLHEAALEACAQMPGCQFTADDLLAVRQGYERAEACKP